MLEHVLAALEDFPCLVVRQAEDEWTLVTATAFGAATVVNPEPERGLGRSVAVGVAAVFSDAVLITLADLPRVPREHYRALVDAVAHGQAISCVKGKSQVPAVFHRDYFEALRQLDGDTGAKSLFHPDAGEVDLLPELAEDFDVS